MSTELIQKQLLTFEDICPEWSQYIKTGKVLNTTAMDIHEPRKCVVGEAHKGDDRYYYNNEKNIHYCSECRDLARWFPNAMYNKDKTDFLVDMLVGHWNNNHV